jgi:hypothetical protein
MLFGIVAVVVVLLGGVLMSYLQPMETTEQTIMHYTR